MPWLGLLFKKKNQTASDEEFEPRRALCQQRRQCGDTAITGLAFNRLHLLANARQSDKSTKAGGCLTSRELNKSGLENARWNTPCALITTLNRLNILEKMKSGQRMCVCVCFDL